MNRSQEPSMINLLLYKGIKARLLTKRNHQPGTSYNLPGRLEALSNANSGNQIKLLRPQSPWQGSGPAAAHKRQWQCKMKVNNLIMSKILITFSIILLFTSCIDSSLKREYYIISYHDSITARLLNGGIQDSLYPANYIRDRKCCQSIRERRWKNFKIC